MEVTMDFDELVHDAEHLINRRNPDSLQLAEKVMAEAIQSGNAMHYAQANYIFAFYNCLLANDYDKAIELCEGVIENITSGEVSEIGYKIYMTLGNAYQLKGEVFLAQQWYLKGLKLLESKPDLSQNEKGFLASFYYNLSLVLGETELNISGEEYLKKAIELYEETGSKYKLSLSYAAYASIFEHRKEYEKASALMEKALELDILMEDPYSIALSKANLGILKLRLGDMESAKAILEESLAFFEEKNLSIEIGMVKMSLGEVLYELGAHEQGAVELSEAEQIFERLDNKQQLTNIYELISLYAAKEKDFEKAYHYQHKYVLGLKQVYDIDKTTALTRAKKEFESEQKEKEADILRDKNEEIKHYVFKLERSNNELNQFAHVASHDLREPLRMITAYSTLLQRGLKNVMTEEHNEFFAFITDAAKRMEALIIDLLRLAKIDANPRTEVVQLHTVVEEIKLNLQMLLQDKKGEVICSELPRIMADKTMMMQLFQNLISNGIKYNESQKPTIIIRHTIDDQNLSIYISDNGIGIPAHQREKAFEIFNRLHTSREYPGTGIGLAICKKIIESLEGSIGINENAGGGTIFKLTLPVSVLVQAHLTT